jgi:hypothetical protein
MLEKMGKNQNFIHTTHDLYSMSDKCALMEGRRLGHEMAAKDATEPVNADASSAKSRNRTLSKAFVAYPDVSTEPAKPAEDAAAKPSKEAQEC